MTPNEKAIIAINAAARAKEMSYGHFVARATAEELEAAKRKYWPREKKRKKE